MAFPEPRGDAVGIFLSSPSDPPLPEIRDTVENLINKVFSPELYRSSGLSFVADRWENYPAQKAPEGETVNDIFVSSERTSALVIVLLLDTLRKGTAKEIEEARAEKSVDIAFLRFTKSPAKGKLKTLMKSMESEVLFSEAADYGTDEAWHIILRPLLQLMTRHVRRSFADMYSETR